MSFLILTSLIATVFGSATNDNSMDPPNDLLAKCCCERVEALRAEIQGESATAEDSTSGEEKISCGCGCGDDKGTGEDAEQQMIAGCNCGKKKNNSPGSSDNA